MVVKTEKATRLPRREDSFADLERDQESIEMNYTLSREEEEEGSEQPVRLLSATQNNSSQPATGDDTISGNISLVDENEQLRRQIQDLQAQVSVLRRRHVKHQQKQQGKKVNHISTKQAGEAKGVVLELPRAMKNNSSTKSGGPLSCLRSGVGARLIKDHQSFATDDDQSTIEPSSSWEAHESHGGLKHRSSIHPPSEAPKSSQRRPAKYTSTGTAGSPADNTRRTEPLSLNDGSLSSEGDSETMNDLNDDEDGELDMESRGLIPHATTEARLITPRGAQEEPSMFSVVSDRAGWLVGLLVLQSMSSFILARNEVLLQRHLVIVRFLTMLVGAGGNAGNQASVRVIRGLAIGTIDSSNQNRFLKREFTMGLALSIVLGLAGFIRAAVFMTPWLETLAITSSLFMIVIISVALGAMLPLGMKKVGIDPAHSSTTIQVIMDILGVSITVWVSSLVLDSSFQGWLTSAFMEVR